MLIHKTLNGLSPSKILNFLSLTYYPDDHVTRGKTLGLLVKRVMLNPLLWYPFSCLSVNC